MLRSAASAAGIDEAKAAQLIGMGNPVVDLSGAKNLQNQYRKKLLEDTKVSVARDPNFLANKERFPNLEKLQKGATASK